MATKEALMGLGMAWPMADKLGYTPVGYTATPGVTVQAGATSIGDKLALLTVASSTGTSFTLPANPPPGTFVYCTNLFASLATASVFPAVGNLLNGVTNGSLTLTTAQSAFFVCTQSGTALNVNWYSNKSA